MPRKLDRSAFVNCRGSAHALAGIQGERPVVAGPDATPDGGALPGNQRATAVARLEGHLFDEASDAGGSGFRRGHPMQRSVKPFAVLTAMQVATELTVPKQPKRSDYFAAIRAGHNMAHSALLLL